MTHYHLYMDETGEFEGKRFEASRIVGLLVPDEQIQEIGEVYADICRRFLYSQPVHAFHVRARSDFPAFCAELAREVAGRSDVMVFSIRHAGDVFMEDPVISETYAANRFLNMAQSVIEHILYLHPPLFGKDIQFAMHPNSRVCRVRKDSKLSRQFGALGFGSSNVGKRPGEEEQVVFYVWGSDSLRSFLHRMAIEYSPWLVRIGKRSWSKVETIVAERSSDPFVQVVDVFAAVLGWGTNALLPARELLSKAVVVDLAYGPAEEHFKNLVRRYQSGDPGFVIEALRGFLAFDPGSYYRAQLTGLVNSSLQNFTSADLPVLHEIEMEARQMVRNSRGEWGFLKAIVEQGLKLISLLPGDMAARADVQIMQSRLRGHMMAVHNHRGEYGLARKVFREMAVTSGPIQLEDYRERLSLMNMAAVADANVFAFDEMARRLEPLVEALEKSLLPFQSLSSDQAPQIIDPLLGWMQGTLGQSLAFLAPGLPANFEKASRMFLEASARAEADVDVLRHKVNLLHLNLDWELIDTSRRTDADCTSAEIKDAHKVACFLSDPSATTSVGTQYALAGLLKHALARDGQGCLSGSFIEGCTEMRVREWFGAAAEEHPFELIFAYVGKWWFKRGDVSRGRAFFKAAIAVQYGENPNERPTFHAIRAEILGWWAEAEATEAKDEGIRHLRDAMTVLQRIGQTPELASMLRLDDSLCAREGWFSEAWEELRKADWRSYPESAGRRLLACFTFNYR